MGIISGLTGLLSRIKLEIGYNRKTHKFDSNRIPEGDMKVLSDTQMIKNEQGRIILCTRKDKHSNNWKCRKMPFKS